MDEAGLGERITDEMTPLRVTEGAEEG